MAENTDTPPSVPNFAAQIAALTAQIAALTAQVQENANKFLALEDENATLRLLLLTTGSHLTLGFQHRRSAKLVLPIATTAP